MHLSPHYIAFGLRRGCLIRVGYEALGENTLTVHRRVSHFRLRRLSNHASKECARKGAGGEGDPLRVVILRVSDHIL